MRAQDLGKKSVVCTRSCSWEYFFIPTLPTSVIELLETVRPAATGPRRYPPAGVSPTRLPWTGRLRQVRPDFGAGGGLWEGRRLHPLGSHHPTQTRRVDRRRHVHHLGVGGPGGLRQGRQPGLEAVCR